MSRNRRGNVVDEWMRQAKGDFRGNQGADRTALYEEMYVRILTEIATNRFKWTGLPAEIDRRFLELQLFRQALVVFFFDPAFGRYFALRGSGAGRWNMYDNPVSFNVTGNGVYPGKMIDVVRHVQTDSQGEPIEPDPMSIDGCVPIWGNTLRTPDWDIVYLQSTKLANIERTIEITAQLMRTPYVFGVDDNEKHSFMQIFKQVQEGQLAVFGTQTLGQNIAEKIQVFPVTVDKDVLLNLQIAKSKMWAETMTLLGVNNANQDKRERLVADEVSANDEQIDAVRTSALAAREYAAEIINSKYNLNITVEWNNTTDLNDEGDSGDDPDGDGQVGSQTDNENGAE